MPLRHQNVIKRCAKTVAADRVSCNVMKLNNDKL